jgi:hypothetical protein
MLPGHHNGYTVVRIFFDLFLDVMKVIIEKLKSWDITVGGVFLMDSQFLVERGKFLSGVMAALSCMVKLEVPHINIMTKVNLLLERHAS